MGLGKMEGEKFDVYIRKVVDFTVKDNDDVFIERTHPRLDTVGTEFVDRKSFMAKNVKFGIIFLKREM